LPWDQSPVAIRQDETSASDEAPTHLLFDSVAYRISSKAIQLGSQRSEDARWIDLKRDMPGVSRQHCSVQTENGQCVLNDQSRYGTFLNGHRIDGSAVLQCGDVIRLGTPGFELQLIRTAD
jgi:pSer/pThr/pTyr-binding forkhead associated (FHA) protein